ncbi:RIP metalloprotease RseP [Notoacmeibacter ruber]|uniref:Zinc metalloprotease n=1 Tax=Notoacmeibacter ruber TaxID=2670375 RepID=A0A3L7JBZ7_9HYPH|nr:RIP metalloprotease RseP [Notoacmeibacter ruber]RLQ87974.1 RIP metalloprotease RseP [Notoacmeibacter ruber]
MNDLISAFLSTDGLLIGTILPFLFVILVVVFVHEMGHYLVGRWCGIGATAFSIGFGPEIAGFTDRNGTRWKLSAIPLGGYVKFVGDMTVTSSPSSEAANLDDESRKRAFHLAPVWKRFLTVLAGPVANFILTIAVFTVFLNLYGRTVIEPVVNEVRPNSPAAEAGFEPGDRVVAVDGWKVSEFSDIQKYVSGRTGDRIDFLVERDGSQIELTAAPQYIEQTDSAGNTVRIGIVGITSMARGSDAVRHQTMELPAAFTRSIVETGSILERTFHFMRRFAMGREDKCQLGGPVKIADMAGQAASQGFERLVELIALLSVGIGFLNLLPIPPLDGGHLVFYAAEAVMRRPMSERLLEMGYRFGFVVVLIFMGFVLFNDIFGC